MIIKKLKNNKRILSYNMQNVLGGFTLIETMVAVIILTFSIAVFMGVISNSFFYGRYASNEITADYLMQEAIDFIRNQRDSVIMGDASGFKDFKDQFNGAGCFTPQGCQLDVLITSGGLSYESTSFDDDKYLYYHTNPELLQSYYNYDDSGVITSFKRKILFEEENEDEIYLTVTVYWENGVLEKEKSLTSSFLKWQ